MYIDIVKGMWWVWCFELFIAEAIWVGFWLTLFKICFCFDVVFG